MSIAKLYITDISIASKYILLLISIMSTIILNKHVFDCVYKTTSTCSFSKQMFNQYR